MTSQIGKTVDIRVGGKKVATATYRGPAQRWQVVFVSGTKPHYWPSIVAIKRSFMVLFNCYYNEVIFIWEYTK